MKKNLKSILSIVFIMVVLIGCGSDKATETRELLTEDERKAEVAAIIQVINNYNKAANEKDWAGMVQTLNKEVQFFGTDSGEVSRNFAAFKETMQKQWDSYESVSYGELQDVYTELDDYASFANIIYGVPVTIIEKNGKKETIFMIVQRTLKKDPVEKRWVICSGILSIPRATPTTAPVTEQ